MCVRVRVYMCVGVCLCVNVCGSVYVYVRVCVCMCVGSKAVMHRRWNAKELRWSRGSAGPLYGYVNLNKNLVLKDNYGSWGGGIQSNNFKGVGPPEYMSLHATIWMCVYVCACLSPHLSLCVCVCFCVCVCVRSSALFLAQIPPKLTYHHAKRGWVAGHARQLEHPCLVTRRTEFLGELALSGAELTIDIFTEIAG